MQIEVNLQSQESGISDGKLAATRVYIVDITPELPDEIVTSETARLAPGVPRYKDAFDDGSPLLAQSIKAVMKDGDTLTYIVTVDYAQTNNDSVTATDNPLNQTPKYSYGGSAQTVPVFFDASPQPDDWDEGAMGKWQGKAITTSANELFEEQPQRNVTMGTLTITRNEPNYDDLAAEALKNTTNTESVTIRGIVYPPNTLRMANITAEGPNTAVVTKSDGTTETVTYWTITYELEKNIKTWKLNLEDRGYCELKDDPQYPNIVEYQKPQKIILKDGTFPTQPYPLDGKGHQLPSATDQPAVRSFQLDPLTDWSALNFA